MKKIYRMWKIGAYDNAEFWIEIRKYLAAWFRGLPRRITRRTCWWCGRSVLRTRVRRIYAEALTGGRTKHWAWMCLECYTRLKDG